MLQRKGTKYKPEEVLVHVMGNQPKDKRKHFMSFDGDQVKIRSQRLLVFKRKGCKCVACGIEGQYFIKEKHHNDQHYHFNLYAVDENGDEVLMTKDHIIPKSRGGTDALKNLQPMCVHCNGAKGDTMPKKISVKRTKTELLKDISILKSKLGSKDAMVSQLTRERDEAKKHERGHKRRSAQLQAENVILRKRLKQLTELLVQVEPTDELLREIEKRMGTPGNRE